MSWNCDWGVKAKSVGRTYSGVKTKKKKKKKRDRDDSRHGFSAMNASGRHQSITKKARTAVRAKPLLPLNAQITQKAAQRAAVARPSTSRKGDARPPAKLPPRTLNPSVEEVIQPSHPPRKRSSSEAEVTVVRPPTHGGSGSSSIISSSSRRSSSALDVLKNVKRDKQAKGGEPDAPLSAVRAADRSYDRSIEPLAKRRKPLVMTASAGAWPVESPLAFKSPSRSSSSNRRHKTPFSRSRGSSGRSASTLRREGFRNLGNTCYMNAVLRSLLSIPSLRAHLAAATTTTDAAASSSSSSTALQCVARVARALSPTRLEARAQPINLSRLQRCVGANNQRFAGNRQQDAHEFLLNLLDQLEDDADAAAAAAGGGSAAAPPLADAAITTARSVFKAELDVSLCCEECKEARCKRECYHDFSLDMPPPVVAPAAAAAAANASPPLSIDGLLSTFFAPTDVSVRCEANGCAKERATSTSAFATTPPVLLLHLKRFHYDYVTKSYTKRTDRVVVPRTLTLDGFCRPAAVVTAGGAEYRLRCVLGHTGKRAGVGHYIVDVVTWTAANARRWTRHNDSVVHEITEVRAERDAERQAYILMYTRCDSKAEVVDLS